MANVNLRISVKYKVGVNMAKQTKIIKSKYKPTAGDRNEAMGGFERTKEFTPCSRCPNPASCEAAGKCLAKSF